MINFLPLAITLPSKQGKSCLFVWSVAHEQLDTTHTRTHAPYHCVGSMFNISRLIFSTLRGRKFSTLRGRKINSNCAWQSQRLVHQFVTRRISASHFLYLMYYIARKILSFALEYFNWSQNMEDRYQQAWYRIHCRSFNSFYMTR